jgi:formyl-CoA transferase
MVTLVNQRLALKSRRDWIAILEAFGVPCSPVNTLAEAIEEEQIKALGLFQQVPGEAFTLVGAPISFDGRRPAIERAAPSRHDVAGPSGA